MSKNTMAEEAANWATLADGWAFLRSRAEGWLQEAAEVAKKGTKDALREARSIRAQAGYQLHHVRAWERVIAAHERGEELSLGDAYAPVAS